jgi:prepilin-type N-terminal cleavage/methylation domain-containing protein/prepilin-type processing-associated H-X9-DG protein
MPGVDARRTGFSLTELLVVVAVILILVAMLIVGVEAVYSYAMQLKCQHRLEQIGHACLMYASHHRGMYPSAWDYSRGQAWYEVLPATEYLSGDEVIACPGSEIEITSGEAGEEPGIPSEIQEGLFDALRWLDSKQNQTEGSAHRGRWEKDGHNWRCGPNGVTGLALLAFLGAGCSETHPEFGDTVRWAIEYLTSPSGQNDSGSFRESFYSQGICTMALADAHKIVGDADLKALARSGAQKGFNYLLNHQPDNGGYTYGGGDGGNCDQSVSGWCYQGIAESVKVGLPPNDPEYLTKADNWLDRIKRADGSSWYRINNSNQWDSTERMTAVALACRLLLGHKPDEADCVDQAGWLLNNDHINHMREYKNNNYDSTRVRQLYYVYYTTLAFFLMGDTAEHNYWSEWKEEFPDVVLACKTDDGDDMCYWPQLSERYVGGHGGITFCTALAAMSLEMAVGDYLPGSKWYKGGQHSYGYNKKLGLDLRSPAEDTIVVMDYLRSAIDTEDPLHYIAPRHSGRVNILCGDGRVKTVDPEDIIDEATEQIREELLTPEHD